MVSDFLNVTPGMRVVDACAGAGGKTLHLAALMKNKGKIIALDISNNKLTELRKRCSRAGVNMVEAKHIESSKVLKRLANTADRLLLDVPCSGLGVLRRNPDTKWKLSEEELNHLRKTQQEILVNYSKITKVGGYMEYATCSILPSEGEDQIKYFLNNNSNEWELVGEKRYSPEIYFADGFYMALLKKLK
jgi:16S rRNA (cytosine967-C5)-methyltransferase